jgi:hypothetical protein
MQEIKCDLEIKEIKFTLYSGVLDQGMSLKDGAHV